MGFLSSHVIRSPLSSWGSIHPRGLRRGRRRRHDAGGADHRILQIHLSWAPTEDEAHRIAHEQWRSNVFSPPANTDLRVVDYDAVSADGVSREQLERSVLIGSDLGEMAQRIQDFSDLGFDAVYLHHVGQDQRPFLEAFGERVLPQLT